MTTATAALRAAIHDALVADAGLTTLLGGPSVFDEPPRDAGFPYVTLARRALRSSRPARSRARNTSSPCMCGRGRAAIARRI